MLNEFELLQELKNDLKNFKKDELIYLILQYKQKLQGASSLLKAFAQENFAQDVMHKIPCAMLHNNIENILNLKDDTTKKLLKKCFYMGNKQELYYFLQYNKK